MESEIEWALALVAIASLAAIQSRAVRGARRHHLQELCRRQGRPEVYEAILEAGETIAFVAATVVVVAAAWATLIAAGHLPAAAQGVPLRTAVAAGWIGLVWLAVVPLPMLLTRLVGAWIVVATWRLWRPLVAATSPFVRCVATVAGAIGTGWGSQPRAEAEEESQDELRLAMDEAHREGHIDETAREMIEGVIDLKEAEVSEIMTPRTRMVAIPLDSTWKDAVQVVAETAHSRLPVWRRSPDDVVGILHARDVLARLADAVSGAESVTALPPPDLGPLLRPPYFVPESMSVRRLLQELQRGKTHLAIVTDEFGGVCGLVTIEDALEEIVGEIADEHDEALADGIRLLSPASCETLAQVPVHEINRKMLCQLPEEADFDTIGGFAFHQFGRIPEVGEWFESHGLRIEVLAVTRRRIERLRIERLPGSDTHVS
jgi:putative hemolysin